jgi:hypothetical protein
LIYGQSTLRRAGQQDGSEMEGRKTNVFRAFLLENVDVLLALVAIILVTFFLVGRFLLAEGTVLFSDFAPTLELGQLLGANYPLWSNGNFFNYLGSMRLPYLTIFYLPFYVFNVPAEVFFKFMILSVFAISGLSMYITARHFLKKHNADVRIVFVCGLIPSLFYAFNPWVMDRIYHIFLLVTYSFLPLIFLISIQIFDKDNIDLKRVLALVLLCSIASTSPHSVFFVLFLIVSLYLCSSLLNHRQLVPKTKNLALFLVLYSLVNTFWILPLVDYTLSTGSLHPDYFVHLDSIRLLSRNSDLLNVIRLVAYWWPSVSHSFEAFPLSALWIFASLTVPVVCFLALIFYRKNRIVVYLSLLSVVLIFLATGTHSLLPGFYEWLVFDAPVLASFGWLFRDPNKWTILLPLSCSILLAFACIGVVKLIESSKREVFRKATALAFMFLLFFMVFVYITPSATNYFEGPFRPVKVPSEIYDVNRWLGQDSTFFNVLWLPSYAEYGATWVYNGLSGAFELDSSAKPTFDSSSKYFRIYSNYFSRVLLENRSNYVANYLNPLNVRYIIFHNDSVSQEYADSLFQSLRHQKDLELVRHDGLVYVFENKRWTENVFQPSERLVTIVGGFDRFVSLNALKNLNFSVVFADQNIPSDIANSNMFVLSGDLLSDVLPFFLNESLVIAPLDFARRHDPAECWSGASLSDLSGGPFHPYLRQFGVESWDFDYDKGIVFTWAPSSQFNIPFDLASAGSFSLFMRVYENAAGGKLAFYLDGSPFGTVDTRSQANRFMWKTAVVFNMTSGRHILTLKNAEGLNAVNLVAVMPEEKVSEMKQRFEMSIEGKDLLYVFEAETDMLKENTYVSKDNSGEAGNGLVVELNSSSRVSRNIELVCAGNYSFAVKGHGGMLFKVDGSQYEVNLTQFGWASSGPVYLSSGRHEIEVSGLSGNMAELDVLWFLKVNGSSGSWDKLTLGDAPARVLSVIEVDPTKYVVEVDADMPFMFHFSNAYDPAWTASFGGQTVKSVRVFGVANGFWIDAVGRVVVTVEFLPQRWFYCGLAISLTSLLICVAYTLHASWSRKRKLEKSV